MVIVGVGGGGRWGHHRSLVVELDDVALLVIKQN